ncbi:MAG TPA: lipopolysaccharide transport periplasmic protein LptA [Candidatus Binatus sp.]|nr:lipopolysaccharide transport periplasmic protein LptA [Candidatus Binatus sp.]
MRPGRDLLRALALAAALLSVATAEPAREPPKGGALFDAGGFGNRKEPITVTADRLEYDYKANVVVYRGDVLATQGDTKVRSDTLTVTLAARDDRPADPAAKGQRLQQIVAVGNVRIDNGDRWATGGRAVFEQGSRTLVLTQTPVLHDGSNEVAGDRVIVYLDENRSVVEGGRKRVKAVIYPSKDAGLVPAEVPRKAEAHAGTAGAATP